MNANFWNQRYSEAQPAYGSQPNDYLKQVAEAALPPAPLQVLCLAEGQGRNALHLCRLGHQVLAVDQSEVGMAQALATATAEGLHLRTEVADLSTWAWPTDQFHAVVSIFGHFPPGIRPGIHQGAVQALQPGGLFIVEAYAPGQLARGTGGPRQADMLYSEEMLLADLGPGMQVLQLRTLLRQVNEGAYHQGEAEVIQLLARKA